MSGWLSDHAILPVHVADGEEIFAIGDVHGRADLLREALARIGGEKRRAAMRRLVFLGDLIDRGPESLGAVDAVLAAKEVAGVDDVVCLMGNHETMLRQTLDPTLPPVHRAIALRCWLDNGGRDVLAELHDDGLTRALVEHRIGDDDAGLHRLADAIGADRVDLLARMSVHHRSGGVVFVHAGLPPNLPIAQAIAAPWSKRFDAVNENEHWAWVRAPFLLKHHKRGNAALFVVHGHTPRAKDPIKDFDHQVAAMRLNLDFKPVETNKLGVARLVGDEVWSTEFQPPPAVKRDTT